MDNAKVEIYDKIKAAVQGPQNMTSLSGGFPHNQESLDLLGRHIAQNKTPGKRYYIVTQRDKIPLYRWHVGEGFKHSEGWWVEMAR